LNGDKENEETGAKKETFREEKKTHFPFLSGMLEIASER